MPLFIKDPDVAEMAERLRKLTFARTKTEAVRQALKSALKAAMDEPSLSDNVRAAIDIARRIGPREPDFDQKRFSDEMWGA